MRRIVVAATALALSACATVPASPVDRIAAAQERFDRVKWWVDAMAPYLPAEHLAKLRYAETLAGRALYAARLAATAAEQAKALADARAALNRIDPQ